jgi:hypothetical protein
LEEQHTWKTYWKTYWSLSICFLSVLLQCDRCFPQDLSFMFSPSS